MKTLMMIGAMSLAIVTANAQDFKTPLKNTWTGFDTLKHEDMTHRAPYVDKMDRIAKKWANEWAPHFYVALCKTELSYNEKDVAKHDAMLDEAEKELDDAITLLGKKTDETWVVAAMIANSRLAADPMNRWQKYGKIFTDDLENAKEINANNPRIYYMKGVNTMFTPKAFGGGKKAAQPYFEKADGFYATESDADITKPYWGKRENTFFLAQCKIEDK